MKQKCLLFLLFLCLLLIVPVASADIFINGSTSWVNTSYDNTRIKYASGNIIPDWIPSNDSGHWTFDNASLRDENISASTNLTNSDAVYNASGKFGGAYNFDTATDYMTFEDNAKWDWTPVTQNRSLSLHFYPTVQPTNGGNPFQFLLTETTTGKIGRAHV